MSCFHRVRATFPGILRATGLAILLLVVISTGPSSQAVPRTEEPLLQYSSAGHVLGFGESKVFVAAADHALRIEFVGGRSVAPVTEKNNENSVGVAPPLDRVTYPEVWEGVTVVYEKSGGGIAKSTYYVAADARGNPVDQIRLAYNRPVHLTTDGDLATVWDTGEMVEQAPAAWQEIGGKRRPVEVAFRLTRSGEVGFQVGAYDPDHALVIDPPMTWNTFLGGSGTEYGYCIAVDSSNGNVYVGGYSSATWGSPVRAYSSGLDAFAAKLDTSGNLIWSTFLGGSGTDYAYGIKVDGSNGNVYIGGHSNATWGSPVSAYTLRDDAFAAKLDTSGNLTWHTFLGGDGHDYAYDITVDGSNGSVYVGGDSSATWGVPVRAYSSGLDAYAAKLDSSGNLTWHTFLGGTGEDRGWGVAVDASGGNTYLGGHSTAAWGTPVRAYTLSSDGFAAKLDSSGNLTWHTFLGGSGEDGIICIAVDGSNGNVYVGGASFAAWGTPVRAYTAGVSDGFAGKLDSSGNLTWHTFLGGAGTDAGRGIAVDGSNGNVFMTGRSDATWGSPVRPYAANFDATVVKLDSSGNLTWHSFLGGSGDDRGYDIAADGPSGNIYVIGQSTATWESPVRAYTAGDDAFAAELPTTPTAVELLSFDAILRGDRIALTWETATEPDNAGFHIWRGHDKNGGYKRVTAQVIPAEGGASWGATYTFEDLRVEPGVTYYYKLEEVAYSGFTSFHGPVKAVLLGVGGISPTIPGMPPLLQ